MSEINSIQNFILQSISLLEEPCAHLWLEVLEVAVGGGEGPGLVEEQGALAGLGGGAGGVGDIAAQPTEERDRGQQGGPSIEQVVLMAFWPLLGKMISVQ